MRLLKVQVLSAVILLLSITAVTVSSQSLLQKIRHGFSSNDKEPRPLVVDQFLTAQEATELLTRYKPLLRESLHYSSKVSRSHYRTSRSVRLPPLGDPLVFHVEARAAALAGHPWHQVEDFQLACYQQDELYGLHRDDADAATTGAASANRAATVLVYLQAPAEGGATLFTRKVLEQERDLDTRQPLHTEAAALTLFRHYCKHPKRKFIVVEPQVGRAVTWPNWYYGRNNRNSSSSNSNKPPRFCAKSTHGACPVVHGEKCVIQQWIRRNDTSVAATTSNSVSVPSSTSTPLRDPRLAAIFTLGADLSFTQLLDSNANTSSISPQQEQCWQDVSTNQGKKISTICSTASNNVDDGPWDNLGAVHVPGGLEVSLATTVLLPEATVSFWGRIGSISPNEPMTLVSLGDSRLLVAALVDTDGAATGTAAPQQLSFKWDHHQDTTSSHDNHESNDDASISRSYASEWLWFSLAITTNEMSLSVYSKEATLLAQLTAGHSWEEHSCMSGNVGSNSLKLMFPTTTTAATKTTTPPSTKQEAGADHPPQRLVGEKRAFVSAESIPPPVAATRKESSGGADISFLVFHRAALTQKETLALRHEAKRYDINM